MRVYTFTLPKFVSGVVRKCMVVFSKDESQKTAKATKATKAAKTTKIAKTANKTKKNKQEKTPG